MEQKRIPLAAIKADPNNPRKNFEGLEELAASFDHNKSRPGEPYIMPIVTYDGGSYMIVDGERRVRAMKEAGKVSDCLCMVAEGLDDMDVVSMMVATDNKSRLTDDELARGVQTMLFFGADPEATYDVAGRRRNLPVKALKSVGTRLKRRAQPTQLSFRALCDAAEVEDDDELNRLIDLSDRDEWAFKRELDRTLSRQKTERFHRSIEEALTKAGVEWVESADGDGGGLRYAYRISYYDQDKDASVARALEEVGRFGGEYVCVFPPSESCGNYWNVCAEFYVPDGASAGESDEERERREARKRVDKATEAVREVCRRMGEFVFANLGLVSSALNSAMGDEEEALADAMYEAAVEAVELYHDIPRGATANAKWSGRRFAPLVAAIGYEAYMDEVNERNVARVLENPGECDYDLFDDCEAFLAVERFLDPLGYSRDEAEATIMERIDVAVANRPEPEEAPDAE